MKTLLFILGIITFANTNANACQNWSGSFISYEVERFGYTYPVDEMTKQIATINQIDCNSFFISFKSVYFNTVVETKSIKTDALAYDRSAPSNYGQNPFVLVSSESTAQLRASTQNDSIIIGELSGNLTACKEVYFPRVNGCDFYQQVYSLNADTLQIIYNGNTYYDDAQGNEHHAPMTIKYSRVK